MPLKFNQHVLLAVLLFLLNIGIGLFSNNVGALDLGCDDKFEWHDPDKDGRISFIEIDTAQKRYQEESTQIAREKFEKRDTDNNGFLTIDEYDADFQRDEINEEFRGYDINEDTFVDLEEYKKGVFLSPPGPNQFEKLFAMDVNKDKFVTIDEYCGEPFKSECQEFIKYYGNKTTFPEPFKACVNLPKLVPG